MPPQYNTSKSDSAFAQFLIDKGIVKDENQANMVMIAFSVIAIGFAIYLQL